MLKSQLARALQLPMDIRADEGLDLLRELDEPEELAAGPQAADRDCDRVIAMLRARLSAR
ncbi:MAG TPA: hypothetical protein VK932_26340 [Kofleriaceae bacterium]|nr:hypothetical protein [Kofleriaceae bacterium]